MARQTVLRQHVYEQIKHDIITCKLAPGDPLSENQFVDRFQVSKTPIREALTSLVQDGLVEYTPNRGFRVTPISVADIQEIFEARIFFESEIFRLAVKKISDAEIDELEKQPQVMAFLDKQNAATPGRVQKSLDAEGRIVDWQYDVWSCPHSTRPPRSR